MYEISNISSLIFPVFPDRAAAANSLRPASANHFSDTAEQMTELDQRSIRTAVSRAVELSSFAIARTSAVRHEIESGTYETPARIDGTVERLLDIIV